jgi:hypothetical protein
MSASNGLKKKRGHKVRIISFIITTFLIAALYGLFVTTMDFMRPNYDPVASGHRAAGNIYGLFGTVNDEVKRNDPNAPARNTTITYKLAMPYAVTADLSAIFGGKIEVGVSSFFHAAQSHT